MALSSRPILPPAVAVLASRVDGMASLMLGRPGEPTSQLRQEMRNLYYDSAGEPLPEALAALLDIADPEHLCHGSAWP